MKATFSVKFKTKICTTTRIEADLAITRNRELKVSV